MNKYRKWICDNTVVAESEDVEKGTDFIFESEVKDLLDEIETRVNDILSIIEPIKGISEIDDLKEELIKFAQDLY